jgi:hypothetical protein
MRERRMKPRPDLQVKQWNESMKVGDKVEYRGRPGAESQLCTVASPAYLLCGHTSVVHLVEISGCVATEACRPAVGVS